MSTRQRATVDDLYDAPGKAELVHGELVHWSPTGDRPSRAAGEIFFRLKRYEVSAETAGRAYTDNAAFLVDLPDRQSFSPDVAFYVGPDAGGKFLQGAPAFAVEVRSEGGYGERAEREMAEKRADYFAAGTSVVWDVDVLRAKIVCVFRSTQPDEPTIYGLGEIAEAEPALPGFRVAVDELFPWLMARKS